MNGKGSARRPRQVSDRQVTVNWARTFRRPTAVDVFPMAGRLYNRLHGRGSGCCVSEVLELHHCDDESVAICLERARLAAHRDCIVIAEKLARMTLAQRHKLTDRHRVVGPETTATVSYAEALRRRAEWRQQERATQTRE